MTMKTIRWLSLALLLLAGSLAKAQVAENTPLFRQLQTKDSILFEEGFNQCNLPVVADMLEPDFEFYHDQNGLQGKELFLKGFKESICQNPKGKPIRKLVKGSLMVYPLYNEGQIYGAIQTGIHDFYMQEPGKPLRFTESGKFMATWLLKNGDWKLKREFSYDHNQPARYGDKFNDHYPFPLFDHDRAIDTLLKALKIPSLTIGYIDQGQLQQVRSFGQQKPGEPIAYNSIYKVASLTKPITAMVVLKLVQAGRWKLDEPLADYYIDPAVSSSPYLRKLTTRYVLSQRSGFPNWRYLRPDKKLVFEFEPGKKFQYSGEGFEYLRKALEKKFHEPLDKLAGEVLFKPLHMTDTHYFWDASVDPHRYAVESDTNGRPLPVQKYHTANAAANLLTTVEDYGKFLVDVLNGAGLSPELYRQFISAQTVVKPGINWGLGMQVLPGLPGEEFALQHTGGDEGTKCIVLLLPKSKRGLIVFENAENGLVIWHKIIAEYFGAAGEEIARRNLQGPE